MNPNPNTPAPVEPDPNDDDPEPCDHEWQNVDASFSHEFGTEVIRYQECSKCGERREPEDFEVDEPDPDRPDPDYEP